MRKLSHLSEKKFFLHWLLFLHSKQREPKGRTVPPFQTTYFTSKESIFSTKFGEEGFKNGKYFRL